MNSDDLLTQGEVEALRLVSTSGAFQFSQGHYVKFLVSGHVELFRNRYGQERVRLTDKGRALVERLEAER